MSIFVEASSGGLCYLSTFIVRNGDELPSGYANLGDIRLDKLAPILGWKMPPPDRKWHPIKGGKYGPQLEKCEVGYIADSDATLRNKPCDHSTLCGLLVDTGSSGLTVSQWEQPEDSATGCWYTSSLESPDGGMLGAPHGRCCTRLGYMEARDWLGSYSPLPLSYDDNIGDYWYASYFAPADRCSKVYFDALSGQSLVPYRQGQDYCRVVNSSRKPLTPYDDTYVANTQWEIVDRETWQRKSCIEFHTTASYTPKSSTGFLGYAYNAHALEVVTRLRLKHIRSVRLGHCHIRYDIEHSYRVKGWKSGSNDYYHTGETKRSQQMSAILVMRGDGTFGAHLDTEVKERADYFCTQLPYRISERVDLSAAFSKSRLAALSDVASLDSNWVENAAGLPGTFDVVNPLIEGSKAVAVGDLAMARRALSSAYLAYRFAIAPNISDYHDVKDNIGSLAANIPRAPTILQRRRGLEPVTNQVLDGELVTECRTEYIMRVKNDCFSRLWNALSTLGLQPSAGHAWDLVPFSFVVDWFTNVGDILTDVSAYNAAVITNEVIASVNSAKSQYTLSDYYLNWLLGPDSGWKNVGVPLYYKWYRRHVGNTIGEVNPFSLSVDSSLTGSQMLLGSALVSTIFF